MKLLFDHFWVMGIVVAIVNAIFLYFRFKPKYRDFPELKKGYLQVIMWYTIFIVSGTLLFAIGDLVYHVNGFEINEHPFRYVLYGFSIAMCLLCLIWTYFLNGIDFLEKHPGVVTVHYFGNHREVTDRFWLKFIFTALPLGGIVMSVIRMLC